MPYPQDEKPIARKNTRNEKRKTAEFRKVEAEAQAERRKEINLRMEHDEEFRLRQKAMQKARNDKHTAKRSARRAEIRAAKEAAKNPTGESNPA